MEQVARHLEVACGYSLVGALKSPAQTHDASPCASEVACKLIVSRLQNGAWSLPGTSTSCLDTTHLVPRLGPRTARAALAQHLLSRYVRSTVVRGTFPLGLLLALLDAMLFVSPAARLPAYPAGRGGADTTS